MAVNTDLNRLWPRIDRAFQGRYAYLDRLGSGGMGKVFLVQARDLGRKTYALKVIDKSSPENNGVDVYAEIQILTGLRHKNIVGVYEAVEDDRYVYIIQEHIDGKSLAEIRDDAAAAARLDEETVRLWMIDVSDALAYIHANDVIHRDIKPGNIMIDSDGTAKLIDFGIARRISTMTRVRGGSTVGSAPYSPLERLQGQTDGPQTDIYAFGATFYSLLTRKIPSVSGREINTLRTSNRSIKPYYMTAYRSMLADIDSIGDEGMRELIRSCVEIDPEARVRDFNTVRYSLRSMDEIKEVHREQKSAYKRSRRLLTCLLIAGILLAGLGIVQMKRDHDHKYYEIIALAEDAYEASDYDESVSQAERAIDFDPNNETGYAVKYRSMSAYAYEHASRTTYEDIIIGINNDISALPSLANSLDLAAYLANAYYETGDMDRTIEILKDRDDLGDDQLMLLGQALYNTDRSAEALEILDRMTADTPRRSYLEGLIYQDDDTDKAIASYTKVLDAADANNEYGELKRKALSQIAMIYMDAGKTDQAISVLTEWMEEVPQLADSAKLNMMLLDCYVKTGDYTNIISQADLVIDRFGDSTAYSHKVNALGENGRYDEALSAIDEWMEKFPEEAGPHIQRIAVYQRIASSAKTDKQMLSTYPDFIRAYEDETEWLEDHGLMTDDIRKNFGSWYEHAVRIVDQIRSEDD